MFHSRYGEEAGKVADDSLHTAGNIATLGAVSTVAWVWDADFRNGNETVSLLLQTYWSWKTWGIHFLGKIGDVLREEGEEGGDKGGKEGVAGREGTRGEKTAKEDRTSKKH